jgi:hypothetical protein
MTLSTLIRKEVENAMKNWCPNVGLLKRGESHLQKVWKIKYGSDFIYGCLVGQMEGYIAGFIAVRHGKFPVIDEKSEIRKMVEVRAKEIRKAVSSLENDGNTI